jgi:hypothetical protein
MKNKKTVEKLVIYQVKSGAIEFSIDAQKETIWANLNQIAGLFGVKKAAISKHFKKIFESEELVETATVSKMETVQIEGNRKIKRSIEMYNLDAIIAVGYRVNSKQATQFRIWATKTLRSYIVDGFAINKNRIAKNYAQFLNVVEDIKGLLPAGSSVDAKDAINLVSLFADTWLSLDAYDRDVLLKGKLTKKKVALTTDKIVDGLTELKTELIRKSEATDIFGMERSAGAVAGIVGNVMQAFGGKELYASVEEKAAHLLYFMVKNHPFTDGNKRSGAFAFVWFLERVNILDVSKLTPSALTALTILVASSDPKEKKKVIDLIINLIAKK